MSAAKRTRADSLPQLQMDRGMIVGPMGDFYGRLSDCKVDFAHELVRRSNAYGPLLKALRRVTRELAHEVSQADAPDHPVIKAHGKSVDFANRVMRDLGEL